MSVFAESTWEPNETADKFANLLKRKKNKSKKLNKNVNFKQKSKPTVHENKNKKKKMKLSKEQLSSETLVKKTLASDKVPSKQNFSKSSSKLVMTKKQQKKNKANLKMEKTSKNSVGNESIIKQQNTKLLKPKKSQNHSPLPKRSINQETKKSINSAESFEKGINFLDNGKSKNQISEYFNITSEKSKKRKKLRHSGSTTLTDQSDTSESKTLKPKSGQSFSLHKLNLMLSSKEKVQPKQKKNIEPSSLRERMMAHLRSSRFRFLNEQLYSSDSSESMKFFKNDIDSFEAYHEGYRQQVNHWPLNPLDVIIASVQKLSKDYIVADFGCGEARLADSVPQTVHSFDYVALNDKVKACDMSHTSLLTSSVHVVVFCLSLMGTNLKDYLLEANRVLKNDGILKIAEVESRFENIDDFITLLSQYGFANTWKDFSNNLFYFMDFKKVKDVSRKDKKLPAVELKSCLYKKR